MILEVAILNIKAGQNEACEADFRKAQAIIAAIKGFVSISVRQCVENENQYLLLVEWERLENHTIDFRQSSEYQEWKALLHHYYDPFPVVEHYDRIIVE